MVETDLKGSTMAIFELRQYQVKPGMMDEWVAMMEDEIIPFITSKGMKVSASFRGAEDASVYVWIRSFENEEERARLSAAVYEDDHWTSALSPKVGTFLNREASNIQTLIPTPGSPLQ